MNDRREPQDEAIPGARPAAAERRALVVDDEADLRETLAEILGRVGYRVDTAGSGSQALERLAEDAGYDVVLSDIRMPQMSGMEFHRRLRALYPALASRFIVVTGDDLTGALRSFLEETGVPCIQKPFVPAQVRTLVAARTGG